MQHEPDVAAVGGRRWQRLVKHVTDTRSGGGSFFPHGCTLPVPVRCAMRDCPDAHTFAEAVAVVASAAAAVAAGAAVRGAAAAAEAVAVAGAADVVAVDSVATATSTRVRPPVWQSMASFRLSAKAS